MNITRCNSTRNGRIALFLICAAINFCAWGQSGSWVDRKFPETGQPTAWAENATTLFAGAAMGGFFQSTDAGLTWKETFSRGPAIRAIDATDSMLLVAVSVPIHLPYNSRVSYCNEALILDACVREPTQSGGLFQSTDNGLTWQLILENIPADPPPPLYGVSALVRKGATVFAGSARAIHFSTDGGRLWLPYTRGPYAPDNGTQPFNSPRFGRNSIVSLAWMDSTLFALTDSALYAAKVDLSPGWPMRAAPMWTETPMHGRSLASLGRWLIVSSASGLRRSRDGGRTWQNLDAANPFSLKAAGRLLYSMVGADAMVSEDTGITWRAAAHAASPLVSLFPGKAGLYAGLRSANGAFISKAGAAFAPAGTGLLDGKASSILLDGGTLYASGWGIGDGYRLNVSTGTWDQWGWGAGNYLLGR